MCQSAIDNSKSFKSNVVWFGGGGILWDTLYSVDLQRFYQSDVLYILNVWLQGWGCGHSSDTQGEGLARKACKGFPSLLVVKIH